MPNPPTITKGQVTKILDDYNLSNPEIFDDTEFELITPILITRYNTIKQPNVR